MSMNKPRIELNSFEKIQEAVEKSFGEKAKKHWEVMSPLIEKIDAEDVPAGYDSKLTWAAQMSKALAYDPELFNIWWALERHVLKETSIDKKLSEGISLLVSENQRCIYCAKWHVVTAKSEGVSDEYCKIIRDFDNRKNELPENWRKTLEFARKVVLDHTRISQRDVDELKNMGYTDAQIVEILGITLMSLMFSRFNVVLNLGE